MLQDGSFAWAASYSISNNLSDNIAYFFVPFLTCVCPSPRPFIVLMVAAMLLNGIVFVLYLVLPFWQHYISLSIIFLQIVCLAGLVFAFPIHRFASSLHRKRQLLEILSAFFRYYVLLIIPMIVKIILIIDDALAESSTLTAAQVFNLPDYTADFAAIARKLLCLGDLHSKITSRSSQLC